MRELTEQHQIGVRFPQIIDLLGRVQADAVITSNKELRYILLPQLHDLLQKLPLHTAALFLILVESPFETNCILPKNRAASNIFFQVFSPPLVIIVAPYITIIVIKMQRFFKV